MSDRVSLTHEEAEHLWSVLMGSLMFFENRDRMNAAVHEADVRFSPITTSVEGALATLASKGVGPRND